MTAVSQWHKYAVQCFELQTLKEWQHASWSTLPGKLMLLVSELDEFVKQVNKDAWEIDAVLGMRNKACLELTDALIRNLADIHAICGPGWAERLSVEFMQPTSHVWRTKSPEQLVWPVISQAVKALEYWRKGEDRDVQICLELTALEIVRVWRQFAPLFHMPASQPKNLYDYLEGKIALNAARPVRHGKVRDLG